MKLLLGWAASAAALLIVAYVVPGFHVDGIVGALIAAVVIGLINATLGNLIKLLTLPFRILTLGILSLIINAIMLMVADALLDGLKIDSFKAAFFGSILLSIVTMVLKWMIPEGKED